jgi:uncharacterized protein
LEDSDDPYKENIKYTRKEGLIMLIEFRVANYRSFKDEQVLDLVSSKDNLHSENLISCRNFNLLKCNAIYGANASGKSNLYTAIRTMKQFILDSATKMNIGDKIQGISPFKLDKESIAQPSSFEVTIHINGNRYLYGFSATKEYVISEWLWYYPSKTGRKNRWVERNYDPLTGKKHWFFGGPLKKEEKLLIEKTRENGLVLSRGAELNIEYLKAPYLWFKNNLWMVDLSDHPHRLTLEAAFKLNQDPEHKKHLIKMLQHADLGIDDINVEESIVKMKDIPDEIRGLFPGSASNSVNIKNISLHSLHHQNETNENIELDFEEDESNGTKRFFALSSMLLDAMKREKVIIIDELDCSLHSLLSRKLLELFQSPYFNHNAQLVFMTHDTTLLDLDLFRRDQIWFLEKDRSNSSKLFSFNDFDIRTSEAIQKRYLAGRYGGVPDFGPIFEDLELE